MRRAVSALMVVCLSFVTGFGMLFLTNEGSVYAAETKIVLTPSMVTNESGLGDATLLVDEQAIAGDPANGSGGAPTTNWQAGWNASLYPAYAYIDLGQSYNLTSLYLRDTHDAAAITLYSGSPGNWTALFTDPLSGWMTWNAHPVNVLTRYVRVALSAANVNMTELVLYGTPVGGGQDVTAPAAITNLAATSATSNSVTLTWTAPGDDANIGTSASYDIRYSASGITEANWASAIPINGEPTPAIAGTSQSMTVPGLSPSTTYHFAMKTSDEASNVSAISNSTSLATTAAPSNGKIALTPAMVVNESGLGDATLLVDEQTLAGDPASGTGGAPTTNWQAGWNQALYPAYAYIDLGQNYDLSNIYLRDTHGMADITLYSGTPGNWTALFTDPLSGWMTWNSHPVTVTTRYVRVGLSATNVNMTEIVLYGTATGSGGGDTIAPSAITSLAAPSSTSNSVTLTWNAPGDDGNVGTAASYDIRYSMSVISETNWASATPVSGEPIPTASGTSQTMTVPGLSPSTTYHFAMKASDEASNVSPISNVVNKATTTLADTVAPAMVTNLVASSPTTNSVNLSWTAPGDDGNAGTATSYDIRYSMSVISEGNWASATQVSGEPVPTAAGTSQSKTITGLSSNTTYHFALKTSDEASNVSVLSNVPSATTLASGDTVAPAAIKTLKIVAWTGTTVTLSWKATGDDGNNGQATSYEVRYGDKTIVDRTYADEWHDTWKTSAIFGQSLAPQPAGGTETLTVTGLKPGKLYGFNVIAKDEAGNASSLSTSVDVMTNWDGGGYPAGMVAEFYKDTGLSTFNGRAVYDKFEIQSWLLPTDFTQFGARVTGQIKPSYSQTYTFYTKTSANTGIRLWVGGQLLIDRWNSPTSAEQSATLALTANQLYEIRSEIKGPDRSAFAQAYWSSSSQAKDLIKTPRLEVLPDLSAPSAITNLTASAIDSSTAQLMFSAPGDDDIVMPGASGTWGKVSTYEVRYSTAQIDASNWNQATQADIYVLPKNAGLSETITVKGLKAGTTYYFAARGKDEAGNLAPVSNSSSATTSGTADTTAPGTISNLTVNPGAITALLNWTAPGDDGSVGQAARYEIRFGTAPIDASNWSDATLAAGAPAPSVAGTSQSMTVKGLRPGKTYFFAIRSSDEANNLSAISAPLSASTTSAPGGYIVSGASTMDLIVTPQEAGNIYYVVYNSSQAQPSASALKAAAQGATGGSLLKNGVIPASQAGFELTRTIGKLSENATYYAYWVAEGQSSGLGTVYGSVNTLQIRQKEVQFTSSLPGIGGVHYLAYVPEEVYRDPNGKYPLLLFLHGGGEGGTDINNVTTHGPPKMIKNGQDLPFIVVSPQLKDNLNPPPRWHTPGYIDDFVKDAMSKYPIDPDRIYVTGLSKGGGGTYYYAIEHPEKVAAILPVAAQIRNPENGNQVFITPENAYRMNGIPAWAFMNIVDPVSERGLTEQVFDFQINSPVPPSPSPLLTFYQLNGHGGWDDTYGNSDVYAWLLTHSK
ncbi:fibronectin type III domain-containing protein [Cohnella herbarum]|uniref:Uncharacterized protein n=1 Tax=Cohnella herbarum TaxID=2728023 RepID=A0A7Z2ZL84_9BACL|nr:fibronectin type III domain-containing protein [Cohnella herbarum]QJD83976.1 hypothetical protein HH215_12815 [Cohnella herbarum]